MVYSVCNDATIFLESSNGYYLNYLSQKYAHMGWYVGLTKEGRAKNGRKPSESGQKCRTRGSKKQVGSRNFLKLAIAQLMNKGQGNLESGTSIPKITS